MENYTSLELYAYRALVKLGCSGRYMVSFAKFEEALEKVSLCDGRTWRDEPLVCAALAINSFGNVSRGDYGNTYKSAATVIEMDAIGESWERLMTDRGPGPDEAAEVLELMLFDEALSNGENWEKDDEDDRAADAREASRRRRNARRRERRRELKYPSQHSSSTPVPATTAK
jgi:hypothetical protein